MYLELISYLLCVCMCVLHSFLLARDSASGKPYGFINFRFDLDDQIEVVYW